MAAYYTRAKARSEVEPEDVEQGDSASVATTTPTPIIPVGLQVCVHEGVRVNVGRGGRARDHPPPATIRGRPFLRGWAR